MSFLRKHSPLLVPVLVLCMLVCLMFPHCRYYVDPDATAYLSIARRYAAGDIAKAVNGYWSPLSCWLTAAGIRTGMEATTAAIVVNTLGALGFLLVSDALFRRFKLELLARWLFNMAMAVFLAYAVYMQLFADLWECFLLLAGLYLLLSEKFTRSPLRWLLYGITGALAYFAKAYAFPFFLLHTVIAVYFITPGNKKQWLKVAGSSIAVMLLAAAPWLWLLHHKYGHWTTSTAGTLNMSWYLEGHAHYKQGLGCLLPPPYSDAVYHWEDPYYVAGNTPHFWTSGHYFLLQCARVVQNIFKMAVSMSALSLFFFPLWAAAQLVCCKRKARRLLPRPLQQVMIFFLLFPLAFLLINFEPRYIWCLLPPGMILGYFALRQLQHRQRPAVIVFALSFTVWPLLDAGTIWNTGRQEYALAQQLKAHGIKGSFTAVTENSSDIQRMVRLAYFSGNSCYVAPVACSPQEMLREMRRFHIPYFYRWQEKGGAIYTDEQGRPPEELFHDPAGTLAVYSLPQP